MLLPKPLRSEKTISRQVREAILDLIAKNNLKAGDKLPSETELCAAFNISRPTLREALSLLEQEGLIRTQHGLGRFLSAASALRVQRPITTYESISVMLQELGYTPETKVLSVREIEAGSEPETAEALQCPAKATLVVVERLRSQDGEPLVYSLEAFPRALLPESYETGIFAGSLNDLLGARKQRPRMSTAAIAAVQLPKGTSRRLGRPATEPWLLITETCLTEDGTPVIHARDYHRGDAISFNFSRR